MTRAGLLIAAVVVAAPVAARAESATAVMNVSLVVEPSCRVSATPLAFAGRAGLPMDAASQIQVACNDDTPVAVRLDGGLHADGETRRLSGERGHVAYAIYSDPAHSMVWDAGDVVSGTAGANPLILPAYGRIAAVSTLGSSGAYTDSITVAVDF